MITAARPRQPHPAGTFTPKLVSVLREGYGPAQLRADLLAGLTVAIVALPLSLAIAVASGATPAQGLHSAIVGGFLVSLLGGSRFQIGGPAGAFIALVAGTVAQHGTEGLALATFLSGLMLAAAGLLRLGAVIAALARAGWGDATVLAATFLLTVFRDLIEAIVVGVALAGALFVHRMSRAATVRTGAPVVGDAGAGATGEACAAPDAAVAICRIDGPCFFGAAARIASALDRCADAHRALVIDVSAAPFIDSTAANAVEGIARRAAARGVRVIITGAAPAIRRVLRLHGVRPPHAVHRRTIAEAQALLRARAE